MRQNTIPDGNSSKPFSNLIKYHKHPPPCPNIPSISYIMEINNGQLSILLAWLSIAKHMNNRYKVSQAITTTLGFIGGETCDGLGDNAIHGILYILIKSWHLNRMQYYGGENTCVNNRMLYAKKVRLSLALLTGRVVRIVGIGEGTLDSGIYRYPNNNRRTNK